MRNTIPRKNEFNQINKSGKKGRWAPNAVEILTFRIKWLE